MSYAATFAASPQRSARNSTGPVSLSGTLSLSWPTQSSRAGAVVAASLDVIATTVSDILKLPDARAGTTGPVAIINNVGAIAFSLQDDTGGPITTIGVAESWFVGLLANMAAAGQWRALHLGTLSDTTHAAPLADNLTIQANGATLQAERTTSTVTGATPLGPADRGALKLFSGTIATQCLLGATADLLVGWWCEIINRGASALTLTSAAAEPLNGTTFVTVNPGGWVRVVAASGSFNIIAQGFLLQNAIVTGAPAGPPTALGLGAAGQTLASQGPAAVPVFAAPAIIVTPASPNLIVNGGCRVGARADAGILIIPTPGTEVVGQVDGFLMGGATAGTTATYTRVSGNTFGSTGYSTQITGMTATDSLTSVSCSQRVESKSCLNFNGNRPFVAQVLVNHNVGRTISYSITLIQPGSPDNYGFTALVARGPTFSVPSRIPTLVTMTGLSTGIFTSGVGVEVQVSAGIGACTNCNFDFTDFGFFVGTATPVSPFPAVPYEVDLAHCKRYLPRWFWGAASDATAPGRSTSTTSGIAMLQQDVESRIAPTGVLTSAAGTFSVVDTNAGNQNDCTSMPAFSASSQNVLLVQAASTANLTNHAQFFFGSGSLATGPAPAYIIATGAEI